MGEIWVPGSDQVQSMGEEECRDNTNHHFSTHARDTHAGGPPRGQYCAPPYMEKGSYFSRCTLLPGSDKSGDAGRSDAQEPEGEAWDEYTRKVQQVPPRATLPPVWAQWTTNASTRSSRPTLRPDSTTLSRSSARPRTRWVCRGKLNWSSPVIFHPW